MEWYGLSLQFPMQKSRKISFIGNIWTLTWILCGKVSFSIAKISSQETYFWKFRNIRSVESFDELFTSTTKKSTLELVPPTQISRKRAKPHKKKTKSWEHNSLVNSYLYDVYTFFCILFSSCSCCATQARFKYPSNISWSCVKCL